MTYVLQYRSFHYLDVMMRHVFDLPAVEADKVVVIINVRKLVVSVIMAQINLFDHALFL